MRKFFMAATLPALVLGSFSVAFAASEIKVTIGSLSRKVDDITIRVLARTVNREREEEKVREVAVSKAECAVDQVKKITSFLKKKGNRELYRNAKVRGIDVMLDLSNYAPKGTAGAKGSDSSRLHVVTFARQGCGQAEEKELHSALRQLALRNRDVDMSEPALSDEELEEQEKLIRKLNKDMDEAALDLSYASDEKFEGVGGAINKVFSGNRKQVRGVKEEPSSEETAEEPVTEEEADQSGPSRSLEGQ